MIYLYIYAKLNDMGTYEAKQIKTLSIRVDALEKKLALQELAQEQIKSVEKLFVKDPVTYVPDGILDNQGCIINGRHILGYDSDIGDWYATPMINRDSKIFTTTNQFKLVECKHEDLEAGDVCFMIGDVTESFVNNEDYFIVLDDEFVSWDEGCCMVTNHLRYKIYKVVEVV